MQMRFMLAQVTIGLFNLTGSAKALVTGGATVMLTAIIGFIADNKTKGEADDE